MKPPWFVGAGVADGWGGDACVATPLRTTPAPTNVTICLKKPPHVNAISPLAMRTLASLALARLRG
jgi:hypothetical protein